jgi:hypothetical protein
MIFWLAKLYHFMENNILLQNFCFLKKIATFFFKFKLLPKVPTIDWRKWMQLFASHVEANNILCNGNKGVVNCIMGFYALIVMNAT